MAQNCSRRRAAHVVMSTSTKVKAGVWHDCVKSCCCTQELWPSTRHSLNLELRGIAPSDPLLRLVNCWPTASSMVSEVSCSSCRKRNGT